GPTSSSARSATCFACRARGATSSPSRAAAATSASCTRRSTACGIARDNPDRKVVFFGIGFETTAPANALVVRRAHVEGVKNFSMLVSPVLVPPALTAILQSSQNRVQAYLGPGHVCSVMGYTEYEPIAARYRVPIVITGFEPVDLLQGILLAVR